MKLSKIEALHESTKSHPKVYKGCLKPEERQRMAEIYKEAGIKPVKVTSRSFGKYRKEF